MRRRTSTELNELGQRVTEWREEHGGRGSRIPDQLWKDAVRVARVEGVWATAKALRFNYEALRSRLDQAGSSASRGSSGTVVQRPAKRGGAAMRKRVEVARARGVEPVPTDAISASRVKGTDVPAQGHVGPSFIALEMGPLGGAGRTVIDLAGGHGDRMRVDVAGGGVDLVGLVQMFWSRAR